MNERRWREKERYERKTCYTVDFYILWMLLVSCCEVLDQRFFSLLPATAELESVPNSLNALDSHRKKRTNKGCLSNLFPPFPFTFISFLSTPLRFQLSYFAPFPEHSDSRNFKSAPPLWYVVLFRFHVYKRMYERQFVTWNKSGESCALCSAKSFSDIISAIMHSSSVLTVKDIIAYNQRLF
jgi:hypothetical protein